MTRIGTGALVHAFTCSGWNVDIIASSATLGMHLMMFDTCPANLSKLVAEVGKKFGNTTKLLSLLEDAFDIARLLKTYSYAAST